jgi:hypothetical protein
MKHEVTVWVGWTIDVGVGDGREEMGERRWESGLDVFILFMYSYYFRSFLNAPRS